MSCPTAPCTSVAPKVLAPGEAAPANSDRNTGIGDLPMRDKDRFPDTGATSAASTAAGGPALKPRTRDIF